MSTSLQWQNVARSCLTTRLKRRTSCSWRKATSSWSWIRFGNACWHSSVTSLMDSSDCIFLSFMFIQPNQLSHCRKSRVRLHNVLVYITQMWWLLKSGGEINRNSQISQIKRIKVWLMHLPWPSVNLPSSQKTVVTVYSDCEGNRRWRLVGGRAKWTARILSR